MLEIYLLVPWMIGYVSYRSVPNLLILKWIELLVVAIVSSTPDRPIQLPSTYG